MLASSCSLLKITPKQSIHQRHMSVSANFSRNSAMYSKVAGPAVQPQEARCTRCSIKSMQQTPATTWTSVLQLQPTALRLWARQPGAFVQLRAQSQCEHRQSGSAMDKKADPLSHIPRSHVSRLGARADKLAIPTLCEIYAAVMDDVEPVRHAAQVQARPHGLSIFSSTAYSA